MALTDTTLTLARLDAHRATPFSLAPDAQTLADLAAELGVLHLSKTRMEGEIAPKGDIGWTLTARLGASVTQACVVTLAPVKTRIDTTIDRVFVPEDQIPTTDEETETELDDTLEPLPETLDLMALLAEALVLALPDYPRAADAPEGGQVFGPEGVPPLTDEAARPFAGLAALKDKMTEQ